MKLYEIVIRSAKVALKKQRIDGSMPAGRNGPWNNKDTPVRNTANWLKVFIFAYQQTDEQKFLSASHKAANYLLSPVARPHKSTFIYRTYPPKNLMNGLVGQAWVIEALLVAGHKLKRNDLLRVAEEVFLMHPFNAKKGLWYKREIDGRVLHFNYVFNHQLWFAAIGSMFNKELYAGIHDQVNCFLKNLDHIINVHDTGMINHFMRVMPTNVGEAKYLIHNLIKSIFKKNNVHPSLAIGYHQFNVYGFGILKENYPDALFWKSNNFQKIVEYMMSDEYKRALENNKYGFPYNVAGIEVAFALQTFIKNSNGLQQKWLNEQIRRHYNLKTDLMDQNTDDPETLSARIYEAIRLKNLNINI